MNIKNLAIIAGIALGFTVSASAEIFTISGTLADSSTISGALNIDPVLGTVSVVDLFVQDDPTDTFNNVFLQANGTSAYLEVTNTAANPTGFPAVFLDILNPADPGTLVGFTGGALLTGPMESTYYSGMSSGNPIPFTQGSVSPVVPEPRFGAVLVVGLAGLGFLARRTLAAIRA
jgi:hypothetical protein